MKKERKINMIIDAYAVFFLLPLIVIFLWSFASIWPWPDLFPTSFSLRGLDEVTSYRTFKMVLNSLGISFLVTLITIAMALPASKALGLYSFRGKKVVELLMLSPLIVPCICVSMGIHQLFIRLGLANTYAGVVLIHIFPSLPYAIRILTSGYKMMGEEFELQSRVLGASRIQTFVHVTLPIMMPSITSSAVMVFVVSYSQYFMTFLIGGGRVMTLPIVMFPYIQSGDRKIGSIYSFIFIVTSIAAVYAIEYGLKSRRRK